MIRNKRERKKTGEKARRDNGEKVREKVIKPERKRRIE